MTRRQILLAALLLAPGTGLAERLNAPAGLALKGHDAVAYHLEGRAVRGRAVFTAHWAGARWRFVSEANRAAFAADPARYAPAYGGFCAYAVARGYVAPIDPAAWRIIEGRLYLNYDLATRELWARDIPGEIARADANWPGLSRQ